MGEREGYTSSPLASPPLGIPGEWVPTPLGTPGPGTSGTPGVDHVGKSEKKDIPTSQSEGATKEKERESGRGRRGWPSIASALGLGFLTSSPPTLHSSCPFFYSSSPSLSAFYFCGGKREGPRSTTFNERIRSPLSNTQVNPALEEPPTRPAGRPPAARGGQEHPVRASILR